DLSMRPAGVMSPRRADPYRGRGASAEIVAEEASATDRLPWLCLAIAVGVFLVASADTAARFGKGWAPAAFWPGVVTLFAPVALRLARGAPSRREGLGIVLALGLGLYLSRVVRAPLGASSDDEFMHLRTAEDIFRTGHLFASNP